MLFPWYESIRHYELLVPQSLFEVEGYEELEPVPTRDKDVFNSGGEGVQEGVHQEASKRAGREKQPKSGSRKQEEKQRTANDRAIALALNEDEDYEF